MEKTMSKATHIRTYDFASISISKDIHAVNIEHWVEERGTYVFTIPFSKLDSVISELQKIQTDLKISQMYGEHHG
jgi:hypothetical protein